MRLPTVTVAIEEDGKTVESFVLRSADLTADPVLRSMTQKTISLMYAYVDILTELMKLAAPVTATRITNEARYGMAVEKRGEAIAKP